MKTRVQGDEKGFILLTSYLLISVMSIGAMATFARGTSYMNASERNKNRIVAFNMAEAGVDMALAELANDPAYAGTNGYNSLSTATVQGGYSVQVSTPPNAPQVRLIQATGFAPGNNAAARAYETRAVTVYAEIGSSALFDFAVFAERSMQINGNPVIDSYDSRNGAYGGANVAANGDIGTNSTANSTVSLVGNATVNGDAQVGPGATPSNVISIGPNAELNGNASAATAPKVFPMPVTTTVSQGDLKIAGKQTVTLGAGTYHYDSLSITGQAQLRAAGPVEIYVDGAVDVGGNGVATQANLPPNLIIYVTGSAGVKLHGNGAFYGAIYAPSSDVMNVGNGELFGAVVSNTYQQSGNGSVHYDEALSNVGGSTNAGISMKSWRENNTTSWGTGTTGGSLYSNGGASGTV